MLDVHLAGALFNALPPTCSILIVGDAEQLPSVGPGAVLHDLLRCPRVPCVSCKHTASNRPRSPYICLYRCAATVEEVEYDEKRARVFQEHKVSADDGANTPFAPERGSPGVKGPPELRLKLGLAG